MYVFLLLFLVPMWALADIDVQEAFDNGRFEQVVEVLGEQYRDGHLSVDEQLLLAKAYRGLGRLQVSLKVLHDLEKNQDNKQQADIYLQLARTYLDLEVNGLAFDLKSCHVQTQVNYSNKDNIEKYLQKASNLVSENDSESKVLQLLIKGLYAFEQENFTQALSFIKKLETFDIPNIQLDALLLKYRIYTELLKKYQKLNTEIKKLNFTDFKNLLSIYIDKIKVYDENLILQHYDEMLDIQNNVFEWIKSYKHLFDEQNLQFVEDTKIRQLLLKFKDKLDNYQGNLDESEQIYYLSDYTKNLLDDVEFLQGEDVSVESKLKELDASLKIVYQDILYNFDKLPASSKKTNYLIDIYSLPFLTAASLSKIDFSKFSQTPKNAYWQGQIILQLSQYFSDNTIQLIEPLNLAIKTLERKQTFSFQNDDADSQKYFQWNLGIQHPKLLFLLQWQLASAYQSNGDNDLALKTYRSASDYLQLTRNTYRSLDTDFNNRVSEAFYPTFLGFLFEQVDRLTGTQQQAMLKEIREHIEASKIVALQNYFKSYCVTERHKKIDDIDAFLKDMPETAILYTKVIKDEVKLILNVHDHFYYETSANLSELSERFTQNIDQTMRGIQQINKFRTIYENESILFANYNGFLSEQTEKLKNISHQLYKSLVEPFRGHLDSYKIKSIVFVADKYLRTIPLSALYDSQHFLVEKYAIAASTGLKSTDFKTLPKWGNLSLLNGFSQEYKDPELGNFPALKYVPDELVAIANLLNVPQSSILEDMEEKRPFFVSSIQDKIKNNPYSIIHFATHGYFGNKPSNMFIITADEKQQKITIDELEKLLNLTQYKPNPIGLLTLSACQTALGDEQAAFGLAGTAIKLGSRSVLAALWSVNDKATANFIPKFYKFLNKPNISKIAALQAAQLEFIEEQSMTNHANSIDYSHPVFWTPFILIGNWL